MPRGRKPKERTYFTKDTEDAIIRYNQSNSANERDVLFSRFIYPAFYKLAENVFNKFKISWVEGRMRDILNDCVLFLFERMDMYKGEKGKAFSYFTIIARNYFWQLSTNNYKDMLTHLDYGAYIKEVETISLRDGDDNIERFEEIEEFLSKILPYLRSNMENIMQNNQHLAIGYAALDYFDSERLEDFNRKVLQKEIAEKVGMDISDDRYKATVTKALNRLNLYYEHAKTHYLKTGMIPKFRKFDVVTPEMVDYILKHHDGRSKEFGTQGLARKLGLEERKINSILARPNLFLPNV